MRDAAFVILAGAASFVVTSAIAIVACGSGTTGPCPLKVPEDKTQCNSGGVAVYCHYDCAAGQGSTYYALCSGPNWSVVDYGPAACTADSGTD